MQHSHMIYTQPALEAAFNDAFLLNRCKLCRVFMEYTTGYRGVYSLKEDHLPWNNISLSRAFAMFRKKGSHSPVLVRWARLVDKVLQLRRVILRRIDHSGRHAHARAGRAP